MEKNEADKIEVTENTVVGVIGSHEIDAEDLAKWAYRRLETWPILLAACELCKTALEDHIQYDDGASLERDGFNAVVEAIAKATA